MKKYIILIACIVLAACTKKEAPRTADGHYFMTVNASKAPMTKALNLSEHTLSATWTEGDVVEVYQGEVKLGELEAQSTGPSTKLSGELDAAPSGELILKYHSPSYASQDGTLAYIAANCDYATATVNVKSISGGNVTIQENSASFTNQQAVVKFTLIDKADGITPVKASELTVEADGNTYTVTPASATDELFVAVPAISSRPVTLTASDGASSYLYENAGATFANSKYYEIGVKMTNSTDYLTAPLTFEAMTDGTITVLNKASGAVTYRVDGGAEQTIASSTTGIIDVTAGQKVSFYGNNTNYATSDGTSSCSQFAGTAECYVYGNIMSLIDKEDFATNTTLTADYSFCHLFQNNTKIFSHASKVLMLPATTLATYCYYYMFYGCTGLTSAPALPAEILVGRCYAGMFGQCTGLTSAPELPAETLAERCYYYMFYGCAGLTSTPALPATSLTSWCYCGMFGHCTELTSAPELPATTLASHCYDKMFEGCNKLTSAPTLPAATLSDNCYAYMFRSCTLLNSVTCLASDMSASNCTTDWLINIAATGTFTMAVDAIWDSGASGIPSGWIAIPVIPGKFGVSNTKKVFFSQGNLRATNTTANSTSGWTWAFATNQWDRIGASAGNTKVNGNGTISASGTVDLFGWVGASSTTLTSSPAKYGISNSSTYSDYGTSTSDALMSDWGTLPISNGGNTANSGWRTLTKEEWTYVFNTRSTTSGLRFAKATVNGKWGVILLPDDWNTSYYSLASTNSANAAFSSNSISSDVWSSKLAPHGCVFLPVAGYRNGSSVSNSDSHGYYWSSSPSSNVNYATNLVFYASNMSTAFGDDYTYRYRGRAVRLVRDTN